MKRLFVTTGCSGRSAARPAAEPERLASLTTCHRENVDIALVGEIRGWLTFLFAALGGYLALRSYVACQRQRWLENSFRMVQLFGNSLRPTDLERWEELFHASSEPAGASVGHFVVMDGVNRRERSFRELFMEGPYDEGAVERMAEVFELIGYESSRGTVDLRSIYFQLGQLMDTFTLGLRLLICIKIGRASLNDCILTTIGCTLMASWIENGPERHMHTSAS